MVTKRQKTLIVAICLAATTGAAAFSPPFLKRGSRGVAREKIQHYRHQEPTRIAAVPRSYYNEECSIDDDDIFACLAEQGYKEDPSITVDKVFVAEIDSLRGTFPSFENKGDTGSNMIKYNKRLRRKHRHHPAMSRLSNNTDVSDGSGRDSRLTPSATKIAGDYRQADSSSHKANLEYNRLVGARELVLVDTVRTENSPGLSRAFHRAGPRKLLHFEPETVNAAIVTCGGLCPGLNTVIRELVHSLYYLYGANEVWGVTGGFNGFWGKDGYEPILLTNEMVENIHHEGGTVLRSSRGGFDQNKIMKFLRRKKIDQLYVIGGDGTHRAAYKISQVCQEHNMNIAVAGIPKTIDNDSRYYVHDVKYALFLCPFLTICFDWINSRLH